jgi:CubicO group peptidase (beta-lactamase class C family)
MKHAAALFLMSVAAAAQTVDKQTQVDHIFAEFNNHTPGCAVGVAQNGEVVLQAGYGMADLERNVAITPGTIFESGSVAKQFTAAALMLLAQEGKISLDDSLRKYLPELPEYTTSVKIRHVLSHVSGLREWRVIATFRGLPEGRLVYDNQDLLEMAAMQRALNFEPGTHYSYTNTGFNLATILIERALGNGKTFPQFTQENIFGPLGMNQTRWRGDYRAIIPNRALAYTRSGPQGWLQDTPVENIIGAGGLLTNVGDLLKWNENFTHAKVGGPELVKVQQTQAVLKNGQTIRYAVGLQLEQFDGLREIAHGGSTGGYRTWLGRYPAQHVSVAVLCNCATANATRLGREAARLWTGAKPQEPPVSTYQADPAKLSVLAGHYRNLSNNTVMELRWKAGKLTASNVELTPVAAGEFSGAGLRKILVKEGPPVELREITPDGETMYERVTFVHPSGADIQALEGKYYSPDTGTTVTIAAGASPEELILRIPATKPVRLHPTFRDAFQSPTGTILFLRDAKGAVSGFSVGESRTWDLRFERIH